MSKFILTIRRTETYEKEIEVEGSSLTAAASRTQALLNTQGWDAVCPDGDGNYVDCHSEVVPSPTSGVCCFDFIPTPDCDNCDGTGIFSTDKAGNPDEACAFCLEDAIRRGELDGTIGDINYRGGVALPDKAN